MRWIKAAAALAGLLIVTVAPPVLLIVFVGGPIPDTTALGSQLTDDAIIRLLTLIVWLLWAQILVCITAEITAAVRSVHLTRVPGTFGAQQHLARIAVGAIIAATVAMPTIGATTAAFATPAPTSEMTEKTPPQSATPVPAQKTPTPTPTPTPTQPSVESYEETRAEPLSVTIRRGDTLWAIAEARFGNGDLWTDIAALNDGHTMNDGSTFSAANTIRPGWTIRIPADANTTTDGPEDDYTVQAGDTLSAIALETTGHADQWPALFDASQTLDQPEPLTDPDLIHPGQHIRIPYHGHPQSAAARPSEESQESRSGPDPSPQSEPPDAPSSPRSIDGPDAEPTPHPNPSTRNETGHDIIAVDEAHDDDLPSWVTPGLVGAGSLLAGSVLIALRARRATQQRHRRPGRVTASPDPRWLLTEKSITVAGAAATSTVDLIDTVLKRTSSTLVSLDRTLPQIAAVELTGAAIALHLRSPAQWAPHPWVATGDGLAWAADKNTPVDEFGPRVDDAPAPWPLLATIGHDDHDSTWLLNLEDQTIAVTGDPQAGEDLARFIAAEIACNPWSRHAHLDLVGIAHEIAPIDDHRIHVHPDAAEPASYALADAVATIDRLAAYLVDTPDARAEGVDPDPWPAGVLIVANGSTTDEIRQLQQLIVQHRGETGTGLVLLTDTTRAEDTETLQVVLDEGGRLTVPAVDLTVTAVGLTSTEAHGCTALLVQAGQLDDEAPDDSQGEELWHQYATTTGSLRDEYRTERSTNPPEQSSSLLPAEDDAYIQAAATTADDLNTLSPRVSSAVGQAVTDADPDLDQDLADWHDTSCARPRLTLLGPVGARASGNPLTSRKPYYTELFAYLATRRHGATTDEVATAFDISPQRVRVDINRLRDWLGTNPETGDRYLPEARSAPAAQDRGIGVYQIVGGLVDIDLFRRLRLRGETRGANGIEDLKHALGLVSGRPFDKLRSAGWGWLLEGDRLDQHLTTAIVDTAHVVVSQSLFDGDLPAAREAASVSALAAPDEDTPQFDLAAVVAAEGDAARSHDLIRDNIANKSEPGEPPAELPARSEEIIETHRWLRRDAV